MSEAITKSGGDAMVAPGSVHLRGLNDVFRLAQVLADASGFVPKAYAGRPKAVAACILHGMELGYGPMHALRVLHIIDGKPCMDASEMLARAVNAGIRHEWLRSDAEVATVRFVDGDQKHEQSFTIAEARAAGLVNKDNWKKYPSAMLRARAVSAGLRAFRPNVLGPGVYTREEISDGYDAQPEVEREPVRVEAPDAIDVQPEEAEASCGAAEPEEPAPARAQSDALADCRDDLELQAWCAKWGPKVAKNADAINKVVAHAETIGIGPEDVWRWLGLESAA